MDHPSKHALGAVHHHLNHLNVRMISKIVTTKLINNLQLQQQYNIEFCKLLNVSTHLHTHAALAYFIDDRYVENFGIGLVEGELVCFAQIYKQLEQDFFEAVGEYFEYDSL